MICLFDTANQSHNNGVADAIFTPHYDPFAIDQTLDPEAILYETKQWEQGINPHYEDQAQDFWDNIKDFDQSQKNHKPKYIDQRYKRGQKRPLEGYIITGKLGLWHGNPDIQAEYMPTLESALLKCYSDCDDLQVSIDNGVLYVRASHHDGTNEFQIRAIGTGRMTYNQIKAFDDITDYGIDRTNEHLLKTDRHIRKINLLEQLGFKHNTIS